MVLLRGVAAAVQQTVVAFAAVQQMTVVASAAMQRPVVAVQRPVVASARSQAPEGRVNCCLDQPLYPVERLVSQQHRS